MIMGTATIFAWMFVARNEPATCSIMHKHAYLVSDKIIHLMCGTYVRTVKKVVATGLPWNYVYFFKYST